MPIPNTLQRLSYTTNAINMPIKELAVTWEDSLDVTIHIFFKESRPKSSDVKVRYNFARELMMIYLHQQSWGYSWLNTTQCWNLCYLITIVKF